MRIFAKPCLFTIGHSDRRIEEFTALLETAGVHVVVDVRRYPASRRHPHFSKAALRASLGRRAVDYLWKGDELGGKRDGFGNSKHIALKSTVMRGYADHMESRGYHMAMSMLLGLSNNRCCAVMCAEKHPVDCHRSFIADVARSRGTRVFHIIEPGRIVEHQLSTLARVEDGELIYDRNAQIGLLTSR